jgi:benzoylformate decarboxylase
VLAAQNPVMVAGPDIDTPAGWDGAVRLAENLSLLVLVAPSPSRCPFPTRHSSYRGVLPANIPAPASYLNGHDLIVAFGAPIFTYHEFTDGDYLPAGAELRAVTSDPDERPGHRLGRSSSATRRKPLSRSRTPSRPLGVRHCLPPNRLRRSTPPALLLPPRRSWTR